MAAPLTGARAAWATAQPRDAMSVHELWAVGVALIAGLATLIGFEAQLAFAAGAILVLGLPHGASDHLVACRIHGAFRGRRLSCFLLLYLLTVMGTLLAWWVYPGPTLAAFLLLSATHFAIDDVPGESLSQSLVERVARGLMPMTLPAIFHVEELAGLFAALSNDAWGTGLADFALAASPVVVVLAGAAMINRLAAGSNKAWELAALVLGLVALPPLVGFALYFALVHSRGQTRERMRQLGIGTLSSYLRSCGPTLAGAALLFGGLAVVGWKGETLPLQALFVGLSALTVPHMLVTPMFQRSFPPRPRSTESVLARSETARTRWPNIFYVPR